MAGNLDLQRLFPHHHHFHPHPSSCDPSSLSLHPTLAVPFGWESQPGLSNLDTIEPPPPIYPLPPPPRLLLPLHATPSPRPPLQRSLSCKLRGFLSTLVPHPDTAPPDKLSPFPADGEADFSGWKLLEWIADDEMVDYTSSRPSSSSSNSGENSGELSRCMSSSSYVSTPEKWLPGMDSADSVFSSGDKGHKSFPSLKDWLKNPSRRLQALSRSASFRSCPWRKYSAMPCSLLVHAKLTSSKMRDILDRKFSHVSFYPRKFDPSSMDPSETERATPPFGCPRSFSRRLKGLFEDSFCGAPAHVRA